jgi:molecular chaperone GrpE (heat shock protein)
MAKRTYIRRSDEELIDELQKKIADIKNRVERSKRQDSAVVKEFPKLQRRLRDFAQIAADNGREDVANSTTAFLAGLERSVHTPPDVQTRNPRLRHVE